MASSRVLMAFLLLLISLQVAHSRHVFGGPQLMTRSERSLQATIIGPPLRAAVVITPRADCGAACAARCGRSWKPKMCKRMCGACCSRCNCVPKGTGVETRAACPCYANMRNPKGNLKCP